MLDTIEDRLRRHKDWLNERDGGERLVVRGSELADQLGARDLASEDLRRADFEGADLREFDFGSANLSGANLVGADLRGSNLEHATLDGADLRGADLRGAELFEIFATGAKLGGIQTSHAVPRVAGLDEQILELVQADLRALDMGSWHSCSTTHCLAGWAVTLAGPAGRQLELSIGAQTAGALIYAKSTGAIPDFYADDADAIADLEERVEAAAQLFAQPDI